MTALITIAPRDWHELREHLCGQGASLEQAAFLFAQEVNAEYERRLEVSAMRLIQPGELAVQHGYHLEMKESTWSSVIKEAHERAACLIEVHSHLFGPARFSESDLYGLKSTAPHVGWRLKGRAFAALVLTTEDFDALVWLDGAKSPAALSAIHVGRRVLRPTALTLRPRDELRYRSV